MFGGTPDKDVYDALLKSLSAKLDAYEIILGKQKYLAGDVRCIILPRFRVLTSLFVQEVTLADLFHLPYGTYLAKVGCDLMTTKGPNVTRCVSFNRSKL
jgi:glutathione S-transferase